MFSRLFTPASHQSKRLIKCVSMSTTKLVPKFNLKKRLLPSEKTQKLFVHTLFTPSQYRLLLRLGARYRGVSADLFCRAQNSAPGTKISGKFFTPTVVAQFAKNLKNRKTSLARTGSGPTFPFWSLDPLFHKYYQIGLNVQPQKTTPSVRKNAKTVCSYFVHAFTISLITPSGCEIQGGVSRPFL